MVLWCMAIMMIAISLGFSVNESRKLVCLDVKVDITDSSRVRFIRTSDIENWVKIYHKEIFGRQLNSLNIRMIEEGLQKLQSIEDVSVYTNVFNNGVKNSEGALVVKNQAA